MNKIQKQYKINEKLTKLSAKKMLEAINQQMRELGWL